MILSKISKFQIVIKKRDYSSLDQIKSQIFETNFNVGVTFTIRATTRKSPSKHQSENKKVML